MKRIIVIVLCCSVVCAQAPFLQNGNFEVGLSGWGWTVRGAGGYVYDIPMAAADPSPERIDDAKAPSGEHYLRFMIPQRASAALGSREYELPAGDYTVSAHCIIDCDGIELKCAGRSLPIARTKGWTKITLPITVSETNAIVRIDLMMTNSGVVSLDDIRIDPMSGAADGIDIGLETPAPDRIFFASQEKSFSAELYSPTDVSGTLTYTVQNAWDETVDSGKIPVEIAARATAHVERKITVVTGHYRVLAQFLSKEKVKSYSAELLLAVIPDRALATSIADGADSRFGCNIIAAPYLVRIAQKIGIRWVMAAPPLITKWMASEPLPGTWVFYDAEVAMLTNAGIHILGNLGDAPTWATDAGKRTAFGGPWPNNKLPLENAEWENYIVTVVNHYYPAIRDWSVWNEPDHTGFLKLEKNETWAAKYTSLLSSASRALKSTGKEVRLIGGQTTSIGALASLMNRTALDSMDVGAFHSLSWSPKGYVRNTAEETGLINDPQRLVPGRADKIYDLMQTAGKRIPLWDTECHCTQANIEREYTTQPKPPYKASSPVMTRIDAANAVPRQFIADWAAGIEKSFFWAPWPPAVNGQRTRADSTMLEWDRSPGAQVVTYAVMTSMLEKAAFVTWEKKIDTTAPGKPIVWVFHFSHPDGKLRVVWGNADEKQDVTLPGTTSKTTAWDMFGAEMTGVDSMNGIALTDKIYLSVGRSPIYVLER